MSAQAGEHALNGGHTRTHPLGTSSRDYVQSLAKGLAVIRAFSSEKRSMTLSEIAGAAGISRPSARRFLLTLEALGYARSQGGSFQLLPKVLDLGNAYISSLGLSDIVEPHLDRLNAHLRSVCSVGILDGHSVVYVARSQTKRVMSGTVRVGTRVDPAATSVGRVLLASLPLDQLDAFLREHPFRAYTEKTITDPDELRREIATVREQGYALVDQEVELGVRTLGAPIRDASGNTIAALNVAVNYMEVPMEKLRTEFLPLLLKTVQDVNDDVARYGHAFFIP